MPCLGRKKGRSTSGSPPATPPSSDTEFSELSDRPEPVISEPRARLRIRRRPRPAGVDWDETREGNGDGTVDPEDDARGMRGVRITWPTDDTGVPRVPLRKGPKDGSTVDDLVTSEAVLAGVPDELLERCRTGRANDPHGLCVGRGPWFAEGLTRLVADLAARKRDAGKMHTRPGLFIDACPCSDSSEAGADTTCVSRVDARVRGAPGANGADGAVGRGDSAEAAGIAELGECLAAPPREVGVISRARMLQVWYALGPEKWRETLDARHAMHGALAYDKCLHGANMGAEEKGFVSSMARAWDYVGIECLGRPTTLEMWLEAHRLAMGHHAPDDARTPGKMRYAWERNYVMVPPKWPGSPNGIDETTWGEIARSRPRTCTLVPSETESGAYHLIFHAMKRKRKRRYFAHYVSRFYDQVRRAETVLEKVTLCAGLQQAMQRMEPCKDGNQRVSVLFLNKHLVECGLSPTVLWWPNGADILSRGTWTLHVILGLREWREILERRIAEQIHGRDAVGVPRRTNLPSTFVSEADESA